jgi:hypothetical protein
MIQKVEPVPHSVREEAFALFQSDTELYEHNPGKIIKALSTDSGRFGLVICS